MMKAIATHAATSLNTSPTALTRAKNNKVADFNQAEIHSGG